jgi:hypothetical protein
MHTNFGNTFSPFLTLSKNLFYIIWVVSNATAIPWPSPHSQLQNLCVPIHDPISVLNSFYMFWSIIFPFCWPCLSRQGFCVKNHYRVWMLQALWPLYSSRVSFFQSHESNFDKTKVRFCTRNLNENTLFILNVISICTWELGLHAIAQYDELMKKMSWFCKN